MATQISPLASVDPRAELADDVAVGPFCVIGPHVRVGRGTRLENNVTLMGHAILGEHNHLFPNVVVGGEPQDISYQGSDTCVIVGDHNVFRENVTINRASEKEDGVTYVGSHNFLMAGAHIGHDCKVGSHVIMANGSMLGGHVEIQDHASLSGSVAVHQFVRIGRYSFAAGVSRVVRDIPPFVLAEGHHSAPRCLNIVGLKRNGFSSEVIQHLNAAFKLIFRAHIGLEQARETLESTGHMAPAVQELLAFLRAQYAGRNGRAKSLKSKAA